MEILKTLPLSLHCWQGDDVRGFEGAGGISGGGICATGNYPGSARTADELRLDLAKAYAMLPGRHRLNLHSIYGESGGRKISRTDIGPEHFRGWMEWSREKGLKLDFNATCFAHPMADTGFTLSSKRKDIREFWMEHVRRCRTVAAVMGREQKAPAIHNLWIPDGSKDIPADRWSHRKILEETLDALFRTAYSTAEMKDSLESKLFGIGSESFVVGSHEFYLGYCLTRKKMICMDMGHFHPTESVADKISSILPFTGEILLHVSRGVRWDSDHVVILNDEMVSLAEEIIRTEKMESIHLALDFFDASIHRVGAWVIGARAVLKALLRALLSPHAKLKELEEEGRLFQRLALMEQMKTMPWGAVWDMYCSRMDVPLEKDVIPEIEKFEADVTSKRGS